MRQLPFSGVRRPLWLATAGLLLAFVAVHIVEAQEPGPMTPQELEEASLDEAVCAMDAMSPEEAAQLM
jgi:hypothetical protein